MNIFQSLSENVRLYPPAFKQPHTFHPTFRSDCSELLQTLALDMIGQHIKETSPFEV